MTETELTDLARTGKTTSTTPLYMFSAGILSEPQIKEGDYIPEGGPIARIADLTHLWVEAQVYTSQSMGFSTAAATATLQFPDLPDKTLREKSKNNASQPHSRSDHPQSTLSVAPRSPTKRQTNHRPGMPVYVTLQDPPRKTLSLPSDAVLRTRTMSTIWVQTAQNTFQSLDGPDRLERSDGYTEILSGLQPGDAVVTSGAYLLQSEYIFRNGADPMAGMDMSTQK